jgi:hypothetical protein
MLPRAVIRLPSSEIATKMRELNGGKFERDGPATMRLAMATRIKTSGSPKQGLRLPFLFFCPLRCCRSAIGAKTPQFAGFQVGNFPSWRLPQSWPWIRFPGWRLVGWPVSVGVHQRRARRR